MSNTIRGDGTGDYLKPSAWLADPGHDAEGVLDRAETIVDTISFPATAGLTLRATENVRIEHPTGTPLAIPSGCTGLVVEAAAGKTLSFVQTGGGVVPAFTYDTTSGFTFRNVYIEGASSAVDGPATSTGAVVLDNVEVRATAAAGVGWDCGRMENIDWQDVTIYGRTTALGCNTWAGRMERVLLDGGTYPWRPGGLQVGWCGDADMLSCDIRSSDTASGGAVILNVDTFTIPAGKTVNLHHVNVVGTTAYTLAHDIGIQFVPSNVPVGTISIRNLQVKGFSKPYRVQWSTVGQDYCNFAPVPLNGTTPASDAYTHKTYVAGAHDIAVDPLFEDEGAGDYRLGASSPCLGAGLGVGVTLDRLGVAYASPPPIGCYAAADSTPPNVIGAVRSGRFTVTVEFDEAVMGADLIDASKWDVSPVGTGAAITVSTAATPDSTHATIGLDAGTPLAAGTRYRVTCPATVTDLAGNPIATRTAEFVVPWVNGGVAITSGGDVSSIRLIEVHAPGAVAVTVEV